LLGMIMHKEFTLYRSVKNNNPLQINSYKLNSMKAELRVVLGMLVAISLLLYPLFYVLLPTEPLNWLMDFILFQPKESLVSRRVSVLLYWIILCICGVCFAPNGTSEDAETGFFKPIANWNARNALTMPKKIEKPIEAKRGLKLSSIPNIILRKYYHLLATMLFLPAIIIEPVFCAVSFCIGLTFFILAEYIRIIELYPIGAPLNRFMKSYCDSRDSGELILTHSYLLVGCSLPLFAAQISKSKNWLLSVSGVLILGIGDSFASLVGTEFGRHKWSKSSQKSVEGTTAGIISILLLINIVQFFVDRSMKMFVSFHSFCQIVFPTVLGGLFEAATVQIDNLFLPIVYYSSLKLAEQF